MPNVLRINSEIALNPNELKETFIKSGGPGGQNVNKVSTGVQLRFDINQSTSLPLALKRRLILLNQSRLTQAGELLIEAKRFRTQHQNREDALKRLIELIKKGLKRPKKRFKTKPTKRSKEKRLKLHFRKKP